MKSEERHELQENDLASWVYRVPVLLRNYGSYALFAVALALLAFQLYRWYRSEQEAKIQTVRAELADANNSANPPAKLKGLARDATVRDVQAWANVYLGDYYLNRVVLRQENEHITISDDDALSEATSAYNKVLTDFADQTLAAQRARLGLGKIYETRGQWDKAREQYQKLADDNNSPFNLVAKERIAKFPDWQQPVVFAPNPPSTQPGSLGPMGPLGPIGPVGPVSPTTPLLPPASAPASAPK